MHVGRQLTLLCLFVSIFTLSVNQSSRPRIIATSRHLGGIKLPFQARDSFLVHEGAFAHLHGSRSEWLVKPIDVVKPSSSTIVATMIGGTALRVTANLVTCAYPFRTLR